MFYIVDKNSTKVVRILRKGYWQDAAFATQAAAKAGYTRLLKQKKINKKEHVVMSAQELSATEKYEIRHGVGPALGKTFRVSANTSWTSGPWSETYWSN